MTASLQTVDVGGAAPYRITIGPGLLQDGALLAQTLRGRHALIVSDAHVAPRYLHRVEAAQRAAIAAAGGVVKAPYLKDDLRPTILSAMFSVLSVPVLSLFAIIALFALL